MICLPCQAIEQGGKIPDLPLTLLSGQKATLNDFKGKVVYLDFWASWCASCAKSLPWLSSLGKRTDPSRFQVIAVNLDSNRDDADKLLKSTGADLFVAYDPEGSLPDAFGVSAMPTAVLVDANGNVDLIHEGFDQKDIPKLEEKIERLLSSKGT